MIYLIIKHGFDSSENHNPKYSNYVGYVKEEDQAKRIIQNFNKENKFISNGKLYNKYKSYFFWEDILYPYLSYVKINEFIK